MSLRAFACVCGLHVRVRWADRLPQRLLPGLAPGSGSARLRFSAAQLAAARTRNGYSLAWLGLAWLGTARRSSARPGMARHGPARRTRARSDSARLGTARGACGSWHAWHGSARLASTRDKARQLKDGGGDGCARAARVRHLSLRSCHTRARTRGAKSMREWGARGLVGICSICMI